MARVGAAVMPWAEGTTYGIVSTVVDPVMVCLYDLESGRDQKGYLRAATGDLDRDLGPTELLYPYIQWTPSRQVRTTLELVALVFVIQNELPGVDVQLRVGVPRLTVHRLLSPGETPSGLTRNGCACMPHTIDDRGDLRTACETRGQWCDVAPGCEHAFSGKVGGNYAGWDFCEPLLPGQVASCRYDNDDVCDAPKTGTSTTALAIAPLCPVDSDFDDCHCAYAGDGMCDEGQFAAGGTVLICAWGSDSSDCCPTTGDGVCDEGRRCPVLSDRLDCFCPTQWNSVCEEVGLESGAAGCAFMADQADCAYEAQGGSLVCPSTYEHNGECDAGEKCPCGTDRLECANPDGHDLSVDLDQCPHASCATSSNCHGPEPQYCAWWSDYSYTSYCRPCVDENGRTCSDFADAVEGSCDVCQDPSVIRAHTCPPTTLPLRLTLNSATGNGWGGSVYRVQGHNPLNQNALPVHSGSPVSTPDKTVHTSTRQLCIEAAPCYRLDVSLLANSSTARDDYSTPVPSVDGSQVTWQFLMTSGNMAVWPYGHNQMPVVHEMASGGYGTFMLAGPVGVAYEGPPGSGPVVFQDPSICDAALCSSGVRVTVEVSPSAGMNAFQPRLRQRWTFVEEDVENGVSYNFPVCDEKERFGAKPCVALPPSGKLQYSLCVHPSTSASKWFRFTYYVSSSAEDVRESGVSVWLNGESVLNASSFTTVRYDLSDRSYTGERPPGTGRRWSPVDDGHTRDDNSCSCDRGNGDSGCVIDCSGRCASDASVGDGVCDDHLNCAWMDHDGGDCYDHWIIKEGRQFNGHSGDWLAFSKDGHDQLIMVAGVSEDQQVVDGSALDMGGIFSSDGDRRLAHEPSNYPAPARGASCQPRHQLVLGNASAWSVCETEDRALAFRHGRALKMLLTVDGQVWTTGAGGVGGYVSGQSSVGLDPASASFAPCAAGLQPLLAIGDWKLCESRDKLCWYHTEYDTEDRGRDVLKFYVTSASVTWASHARGHFLSTTSRTTPVHFETASASVTNGVWRSHLSANGTDSDYVLWINGRQLQKSSGDSIAQFTSDCFNSGIVIAIFLHTCAARECSRHSALRFSSMWCGELITTNADDWKCSTQEPDRAAVPDWQHRGFVEDSTWVHPQSMREQAGNESAGAFVSVFSGDSRSEWIRATDRGDHPTSVWCRFVRQPRTSAAAGGDLADGQGFPADGEPGWGSQGTADVQQRRNSQVSGYVILGALLAASVAALTRKFFNQSWQQKLDGELHLGMVVGYEESQFDYNAENPVSRREDDVNVAVRQSILNRFGDDHEAIGSIIDTGGLDNLSIAHVIGRGARSVVYAAEYMGCRVALKQLQLVDLPQRTANGADDGNGSDGSGSDGARAADTDQAVQQVLKEFASEVRMLSKLQHPNVIKYVGFTTNPHCLIIQEFAPNGDLRSYLEAQKKQHLALLANAEDTSSLPSGPLTLEQQVTMGLDIARGMEYLHGRTPSVLHRDLKTPNLLVDENLRIKITDFGLAREKDTTIEGKTGLMTVCGTPLWTAPEILKGQLYNEAADVYSFSLCLWEVWAMTIPFHELGLGPMEVLLQVVNDDRRPTMPEEIPPLFADLVARCWATDARERPMFPAIVAELDTFAELSGISAILAPASFSLPPKVSAELSSIDSVQSVGINDAAGPFSDSVDSGLSQLGGESSVFSGEREMSESSRSSSIEGRAGLGVTAI